jgi:sporadic carbohydrate cluster 2OG-Fe(II) oxygenase
MTRIRRSEARSPQKGRAEPESMAAGLAVMRERGFVVVSAEDPEPLQRIRGHVVACASELLGIKPGDPIGFLDRFHERGLGAAELNEFRVKLIQRLAANTDIGGEIWRAFEGILLRLVGPDVVMQKTTNLVIQPPGDRGGAPIHRDAPPNSAFEVVVWLPLVDCYGTKSMQILDAAGSRKGIDIERANPKSQAKLSKFVRSHGEYAAVPFGSALLFWTGLIHVTPVNAEAETRWSLNIRYKNAFSPYGTKGIPDYFRILQLSPLSQLALDDKSHLVYSHLYSKTTKG